METSECEGLTWVTEVKEPMLDETRRRESIREALYVNTCCRSWEVLSPLLSQSAHPPVNFDQPCCCSARPLPPPEKEPRQPDRQRRTFWMSRLRGLKLVLPPSAQRGQIRETEGDGGDRGREGVNFSSFLLIVYPQNTSYCPFVCSRFPHKHKACAGSIKAVSVNDVSNKASLPFCHRPLWLGLTPVMSGKLTSSNCGWVTAACYLFYVFE